MENKQTTPLGGIVKFFSLFAFIIWVPAYFFDYIILVNIFFGIWAVSGLIIWVFKI